MYRISIISHLFELYTDRLDRPALENRELRIKSVFICIALILANHNNSPNVLLLLEQELKQSVAGCFHRSGTDWN